MKINTKGTFVRVSAQALLSAALVASYQVEAQEQDPVQSTAADQGSAQQNLEELVVTGTRIVRTGMETPTPVTMVSNAEMDKLAPGADMVDALSQLPAFLNNTNAVNRGTFLGAAGGAFLNLRGLGTQRTLVLLNGYRMPPAGRESSVDTNLFPKALIKRVDVVTGGASAVYGADALAGVVNFILNTDFEGFEAKFEGGQTMKYHDGDHWDASFTGGVPVGDHIHVTFSGEVFQQAQVQGKVAGINPRTWLQHYGWVTNPAWNPADPPGTHPQRLTLPDVHSTEFTAGGKINQPGFAYDQYEFVNDGTQLQLYQPGAIADYNGTQSTSGGPDWPVAEASARNILSAQAKRKNIFVNANFEPDGRTTYFLRAMQGENNAYQRDMDGGLAPSLMGIWHATIFKDNAFLPESIRQAMTQQGLDSLRLDKGGMLVGPDHHNFQDHYADETEIIERVLSAGLNKKLANDWTISGILQYGKDEREDTLKNLLRFDRMYMAMDAVEVYPGTTTLVSDADRGKGQIICNVQRYNPTPEQLAASVADVTVSSPTGPVHLASPVGLDNSIQDCVPLNVFGYGNVSPEAAKYVVSNKWTKSVLTQKFAEADVSGDVFDNWYAGAMSFSVGATYRAEKIRQTEYPLDIAALGPVVNAPDIGIRGVSAGAFGEPDLHQFSAMGGSFGGSFNVSEIFGELYLPLFTSHSSSRSVSLDLAERASDYSRAGLVKTWKIGLSAQVLSSLRLRTTLSRDAREATFEELFDIRAGGGSVNDPLFDGQNVDTDVSTGGNPDLKPEQADTYTYGLVYQPRWARGLAISVDNYDIDLTSTIGTLGTQRIVDDCYQHQVQAECDLIRRDPATNVISLVVNQLVNINNARVRGTDMELDYTASPHWFSGQSESLSLRFLASHLAENSTTPLGGVKQDLAGSTDLPEWTTTTMLNFSTGRWSAYVQNRYISSTILDPNWVEGVDVDDNTIDSIDYVNLGLTYTLPSNSKIYGNIIDANDEHPPIIPTNVGRSLPGSTGFATHNAILLGRRFILGASVHF